jgi:hypothetical protein
MGFVLTRATKSSCNASVSLDDFEARAAVNGYKTLDIVLLDNFDRPSTLTDFFREDYSR